MAIKLVSRAAWGARSPRGSSYLGSTKGVKVHYTGSPADVRMRDDHKRCAPSVRNIQNGHMDGNGWVDIGYSMVVCPHGFVFVGRGPHVLPSANGPGLNSGHYAVLGLVGSSGLTEPTDAMLAGIRDAIDYLRKHGGAGSEIKGHKDGYSTSCPGPALYAWIKKGAPRPSGGAISGGDDMPEFTDSIPVGATFGGDWKHKTYPLSFMTVAGATYSKRAAATLARVEAQLTAQQATIEELSRAVAALAASGGQDIDADELIRRIGERLEQVEVHLTVAENDPAEDPAEEPAQG